MDFLSRDKSPSYVYRHGQARAVDPAGNQTQAARHSAIIKFEVSRVPYQTRKLSGKDNLAYGRLYVHKVLEEFGNLGYAEVTRDDVINFLVNHSAHGRDFVFVGEDVDALSAEWLEEEPDGKNLYCSLCDKHGISKRGGYGHEQSKEHNRLLEAWRTARAEELGLELPVPAEIPPPETKVADVSA